MLHRINGEVQTVYDQAYACYERKEWDEAIKLFAETHDQLSPPFARNGNVEYAIDLDCLYKTAFCYKEKTLEQLKKKSLVDAIPCFMNLFRLLLGIRENVELARNAGGFPDAQCIELEYQPLVNSCKFICENLLNEFNNQNPQIQSSLVYEEFLLNASKSINTLLAKLAATEVKSANHINAFYYDKNQRMTPGKIEAAPEGSPQYRK